MVEKRKKFKIVSATKIEKETEEQKVQTEKEKDKYVPVKSNKVKNQYVPVKPDYDPEKIIKISSEKTTKSNGSNGDTAPLIWVDPTKTKSDKAMEHIGEFFEQYDHLVLPVFSANKVVSTKEGGFAVFVSVLGANLTFDKDTQEIKKSISAFYRNGIEKEEEHVFNTLNRVVASVNKFLPDQMHIKGVRGYISHDNLGYHFTIFINPTALSKESVEEYIKAIRSSNNITKENLDKFMSKIDEDPNYAVFALMRHLVKHYLEITGNTYIGFKYHQLSFGKNNSVKQSQER